MFKEFKAFAMRGNVMDMAIGIIIGGAFGTIVKSLVSDVLMPPIGLLLGGIDFSQRMLVLKAAQGETPAVTLNYGTFINSVISFLIIAWAVFLVVKGMNSMKKKEEAAPAAPTTKDCPFCATAIPIPARRCPHCTSELKTA